MSEYWKLRAPSYNESEWVKRNDYLEAFIKAANLNLDQIVLDVGTGTGLVAKAIAPYVKKVIAIDISKEMLRVARRNTNHSNVTYLNDDVRKLYFKSNYFNLVTARMVFHHILTGREKAMKECYNVLKPNGVIVFSEGVPPTRECRLLYDEIFALKEKRVSFMPEDIRKLLRNGGFIKVKLKPFFLRRVSTRKWLKTNLVPEPLIQKILKLHVEAPEHFKKAYKMEVTEDDAIVDWKFIIAVGMK